MSDELKQVVEDTDLFSIMATSAGRNIMARILEYTSLNHDVFDKDTHQHAFNAGKRDVGVWLRNEIVTTAPDKYMLMLQEQIDE